MTEAEREPAGPSVTRPETPSPKRQAVGKAHWIHGAFRLYRDDVDWIVTLLQEHGGGVEIQTGEWTCYTVDQLFEKVDGAYAKQVEIRGRAPHITVDLGGDVGTFVIMGDQGDPASIGLAGLIRDRIRARRTWTRFVPSWAMVVLSLGLLIAGATGAIKTWAPEWRAVYFALLAVVLFYGVASLITDRDPVRVYRIRSHERPRWLQQHGSEIAIGLLLVIVGAILTVALQSIWPK
jgi:uncharacterized membrane protein